jgi:hypothetical protein
MRISRLLACCALLAAAALPCAAAAGTGDAPIGISRPLVEIGFMPEDLSSRPEPDRHRRAPDRTSTPLPGARCCITTASIASTPTPMKPE